MRLPDFIIIGAAKCGTTSLYKAMVQHPNIFMSTPKEPTFFAIDGLYEEGMASYANLFVAATEGQLCGEASTNYTNWPKYQNAAARIAQHLPRVKLIYMMRHPVDRAYSHYAQLIENERVKNPELTITHTFEEFIEKDSSVLDSSNYLLQIEQFLKHFPRHSFLFLLLEDLKDSPDQVLNKVCGFLGIEQNVAQLQNNAIAENRKSEKDEWQLRSRLTAPLRAMPGGKALAEMLPQGIKDGVYSMLKALPYRKSIEKTYIPQPMCAETRERLLEYFKEPNQRLSEFLGRDLSHWSS